jgi:hypothetical protein
VQDLNRLRHRIKGIEDSIGQQVDAATDPSNAAIKADILAAIAKKKDEIGDLETQMDELSEQMTVDKEAFLRFAFDFVESMGARFLDISPENRAKCKQIIFPAGIYWNRENRVYTTEVSPLISLARSMANKKDAEAPLVANLVRVQGLKPWTSSLARKRSIN